MKRVNEYNVRALTKEDEILLEKYLENADMHVKLYIDEYNRLFDEYNKYICDVEEVEL